jgi:protein-tyrosine phosphatase
LRILRAAKDAGITAIAATPHFYPHRHHVDSFLERRDAALERIRQRAADEGLPKIVPGAEVLLCPGLYGMHGLKKLCLRGTNVLLLEMPFVVAEHTDDMFETIERLITERGFLVYIAHPNRYPDETIDRVLEMDVRLQINLEDIGHLKERGRIKKWVKAGKVHAVGSDVHHDPEIYKKLPKALSLLEPALDQINHPLRGSLRTDLG